jgi:hypothetical protein
MKGIIVIIVAAIILLAASADLFYVDRTFGRMQQKAENILEMIQADEKKVDSEENIAAALELENYFHRHGPKFNTLIHQTMINELAYKVVALTAHIKTDDYEMAVTTARQVIESCRLLKQSHHPRLTNIL